MGLRRLAAAVLGEALCFAAGDRLGLGDGPPATDTVAPRPAPWSTGDGLAPRPFPMPSGLSWLETGPEGPAIKAPAPPHSAPGEFAPGKSTPRAAPQNASKSATAPPVIDLGTPAQAATAPQAHVVPELPRRVAPPAATAGLPGTSLYYREAEAPPPSAPAITFPKIAPAEVVQKKPAVTAVVERLPAAPALPPLQEMVRAPVGQAVGSAAQEQPGPSTRSAVVPSGPRIHTAVVRQAEALVQEGYAEAQRRMFYSARTSFIQSLSAVAQALDAEEGTQDHARALAAGLRALDEAEDFAKAAAATGPVELAQVVVGHQTPVLKSSADVSPLKAQQAYYVFAQEQLAAAVRGVPVGSAALTGLGRLSGLMAHEPTPLLHNCQATAVVCFQAALLVDVSNAVAANELGVFLARQGQLEEARGWLQHSVAIQPRRESWSNLAVVCRQLGDGAMAERAKQESVELARREAATGSAAPVRWVDPKVFAGMSATEAPTREPAKKPAAESADGRAKDGAWSWMPWRK